MVAMEGWIFTRRLANLNIYSMGLNTRHEYLESCGFVTADIFSCWGIIELVLLERENSLHTSQNYFPCGQINQPHSEHKQNYLTKRNH